MTATIEYDAGRAVLLVGDGKFGPVRSEVWEYSVGGKNVIKSWFNYRKKEPGGKKLYLLDFVYPETWDPVHLGACRRKCRTHYAYQR